MDQKNWDLVKTYFSEAVELGVTERSVLLGSIEDERVRAEVAALLSAHDISESFISKPIAVEHGFIETDGESEPGLSIDGYRILRKIGTGGMGTVYLAEHTGEGFTQKVALKVIKRGMDTDAVLRRFFRERQILAQLDHANIARMIDGGSTAEGLPYVVMEYVEGVPLREYCNHNPLGIRDRLRLFQKICSALTYAHRKLVVHRDLKPSNILVSDDGEPKLVDFGIAKLLDPQQDPYEAEATVTQFRVLTPEYASPEQIRGEAATTSTDIYSLGVVLYELLTGVRPYEVSGRRTGDISVSESTHDPARPSMAARGPGTLDRPGSPSIELSYSPSDLKGDLDNIVLKAIRFEPERRYQSISDLSDDIDRYLSGLPVKATGDSRSYRFNKFYQRNRAAVLSGGLASALLIFTSVFASWQYFVAERERDHAERRFADIRGLARTIIFDHYERIKNLPGATEAREKLISDALAYLDKLAAESAGDKQLQRELVAGYSRLAEIQDGRKEAGNLGMPLQARENLLKAIAIQETLASAPESEVSDIRDLANMYLDASEVFVNADERARRSELILRAHSMFSGLRDRNPDKKQANSDLARSLWFLASDVRSGGDNKAAIDYFGQAIKLYEAIAAEFPDDVKNKRNMALSLKNLGSVFTIEKRFQESLESFQKALTIDSEAAQAAQNDVQAQMDLAFTLGSVGSAYRNLNDAANAVSTYYRALSIQEDLYQQDPKNSFVKRSLFRSRSTYAEMLRDNGQFDDSELWYKNAFSLLESIDPISLNPLDKARIAAAHFSFGLFYERKAANLSGQQRNAEIRNSKMQIETALKHFAQLEREGVLDPSFIPIKNDATLSLGRLHAALAIP